uniref:Zinc-finger homeodomain protein 4 n=2 Tax=Noccaea caerulescens TaxID=107243 RepID=A0A1J3H9E5_NOCCA
MEIASQDQDHDMPIPLSTTFVGGGGHGHMIHHHHDHHAANSAPPTHNINNNTTTQPPQMPLHGNGHGNSHDHHPHHQDPHHVGYNAIIKKPMIKYKECLKNHAAAIGGNATDGCGEFMPSGEDGSIEALTCSACNCHRNFHRKEVEGESTATAISSFHQPPPPRKLMLNHHNIRSAMPHQMIMPIGVSNYRYMHNSESEDFMEEDGVTTASRPLPHPPYNQKKRFRTKFTPEQKEKMLSFAERVGWKIQRQEDCVVQRFCEEIGVKRRVLKVWMHNNKLHFSKKNNINLEDNDNEKINNLNNVDLSGNNDITKIVP